MRTDRVLLLSRLAFAQVWAINCFALVSSLLKSGMGSCIISIIGDIKVIKPVVVYLFLKFDTSCLQSYELHAALSAQYSMVWELVDNARFVHIVSTTRQRSERSTTVPDLP
ncbi:hypothetical protein FHX77_000433 [Bifidobacterium commune]|uniref:Uncharacterized protein n=1 Tax=Bifidobacterium commune TaxID=1505727 RepID=A0A1C4H3B8_9BIFI|nr:hypothetical protein [Bifidobacterium commune]SCC79345.1 hypothetical protein GA0061077_0685 [Bifidobacterium commune]